MRFLMLIFYLILALFGVSFAALNASLVQVNLYVTILSMPISVLIIVAFALGVVFGGFLLVMRYWRLKIECHKIKSQLQLTEKEIKNLRSIPLQDQH